MFPLGWPQDPDLEPSKILTFATELIGIFSLQTGNDSPPKACPGPPRPSPGDDCASDFSSHSSLLWQRVFVSQSPLGAVGSGEGECGNLSGGAGGDPSLRAFGLRGGLGLPEYKGPAFPLQPLAPSRDAPTLRLLLRSAPLVLASLGTCAPQEISSTAALHPVVQQAC